MSIASRLKSARLMRALSLKDLVALTGGEISLPTLSRYERSEAEPDTTVLRLLARALELPYAYFTRPAKNVDKVEFRKRSRLGKKVERQILEQTRDFLERYAETEHLLSVERGTFPSYDKVVATYQEAEEAATALREKWRLGDNPIHSIVEEMESRGIRIMSVNSDESFDGLSSTPDSEEDFIVYNINKSIDRQRFTLLHELGHHYFQVGGDIDSERLVNRFAGAFAVPEKVMKERIGNSRKQLHPVELIGMKRDFGLSIAALLYRAKDLGIITEYTHRNAMITISQIGWRKEEPNAFIGEEKPTRLLELLGRGIAEECISQSKAAELYGTKLGEFRDILLGGDYFKKE